jgi:serine/threonine-protein kinase
MGSPAIAPNRVLLGKYRIEEVLGRGGMGVVVRARHLTLDEVVAIKLLGDDMALTPETFARFEREARAAAKLKSEHVVRVTDVGRLDDGMPYMVMELLEGRDLAQAVANDGPVAYPIAANLVIQLCEVLGEAHTLGIVHRDMKPSNVFLTTRDSELPFVKVLDFGIAKAPEAGGGLTRTSSVLGTPDYMSPEQLRSSRSVDRRTDVWALGVLLYEVIEGRRPFTGETVFELCFKISDNPPPPMVRAPAEIEAIISRCLSKSPDDRYPGTIELATALAPYAADPEAAQRDLERLHRVLRASAGRIANDAWQPTPPRGRMQAGAAVEYSATVDATPQRAAPQAIPGPTSPMRMTPELPHPPPVLPAATPPPPVHPVRARRGSRAWIVVAALVVATGGAAAMFAFGGEHDVAPPHVAPPVVETPAVAPAPPVEPPPPQEAAPAPIAAAPDPAPKPAPHPAAHVVVHGQTKKAATVAPPAAPPPPKPELPAAGSGSAKPCDPYSRLGC